MKELRRDHDTLDDRDLVTGHHEPDRNEDPISGEPGAHPIGVGVGTALGGAAAGAAAGTVAGPVGTIAGAIVGGVAGAFAGKAVAEHIDPTEEASYWRDEYPNRDYYRDDLTYDRLEPAYRHGWESWGQYDHGDYDAARPTLQEEWERTYASQTDLDWTTAEPATRDAWDRLNQRVHDNARSAPKPR